MKCDDVEEADAADVMSVTRHHSLMGVREVVYLLVRSST